jgi:type II secretory pathway pseudopilin PulG
MFGFSPTVIIVVAVVAVMTLLLLTPLGRPRRKRAEKWEKAEIMRKLLALSDQEAGKPKAVPARTRPAVSRPAPARVMNRPANVPMKASTSTSLPGRSKVR